VVPDPDCSGRYRRCRYSRASLGGFCLHDRHRGSGPASHVVHSLRAGAAVFACWGNWPVPSRHGHLPLSQPRKGAARPRQTRAMHVIYRTRSDFVEAVMEITQGKGADVIYDAGRPGVPLISRSQLWPFAATSSVSVRRPARSARKDIGALASKSVTLSRPNSWPLHRNNAAEMQHGRVPGCWPCSRESTIDAPTVIPGGGPPRP